MTVSSMTGFGKGRAERVGLSYEVRIKGVNHKYLDVVGRWPSQAESFSDDLVALLRARLQRGRVELAVERRAVPQGPVEVVVEEQRLLALHGALAGLAIKLGAEGPSLRDLIQVGGPSLFRVQEPEWPEELERELAEMALGAALEQFTTVRRTEGAKLAELLAGLNAEMDRGCAELRDLARDEASAYVERLRKRAEELFGQQLDPLRLHQEAALLAERVDVSEELDRMGLHTAALAGALATGGAIGKKLDFLCQEMLRELNTAGSKLAMGAARHRVVDLKSLLERVREQVQNLE